MVWNAEPAECRFNAFYRNTTLPETNIAHENPIFPGKYHQNGGFSWAMLVLGRVKKKQITTTHHQFKALVDVVSS